jgi:glutaredoxin 2
MEKARSVLILRIGNYLKWLQKLIPLINQLEKELFSQNRTIFNFQRMIMIQNVERLNWAQKIIDTNKEQNITSNQKIIDFKKQ